MRPVRSHVFRGKRYRIRKRAQKKVWGTCDSPKRPSKTLYLDPEVMTGGNLNALTISVHEGLHACLWDLDEDSITETSTCVARFLWRLGWRRMAA